MTMIASASLDEKTLNTLCAYISGKSLDTFFPASDTERGRQDFSVLLDTMLNQIAFSDVFTKEGDLESKVDLQRKVCQAVVDLKYPKGVPEGVLGILPSATSRTRLVDELVANGISILPVSRQVMRI